MQTTRILIWTFVSVMTFVDLAFAISHESSLPEWEVNPVACFLYGVVGMTGLLVFRLGTVAFAYLMSQVRSRIATFLTVVVFIVHVCLMINYIIILYYCWSVYAG